MEEIREQSDSLDNLCYGKLWCHQSMKHMTVAHRLERPQWCSNRAREQGQSCQGHEGWSRGQLCTLSSTKCLSITLLIVAPWTYTERFHKLKGFSCFVFYWLTDVGYTTCYRQNIPSKSITNIVSITKLCGLKASGFRVVCRAVINCKCASSFICVCSVNNKSNKSQNKMQIKITNVFLN